MKFINLILENVKIPFEIKCVLTIVNSEGNKIQVNCEIPTTEEEKMTGLMYRDSLDDDCGMFYDYVNGGFWMKNVEIPLEMIFIDGDTIVDIKEGKPYDETTIYPSQPCDGNLEVNKGFCEENNIQIGDKVYRS